LPNNNTGNDTTMISAQLCALALTLRQNISRASATSIGLR